MTLVGRTTAIKTLTDAFTDCAEGCSRTVLVEGPAGCGKSALLHLLIERAAAAGAVVLCATGTPAGRRTAWGVVRQLLPRTTAGAAHIDDMRALGAALRETSGDGPLVVCVDDVHHADAESLAFVRHLARHARPARMLLVVAGTVHHESGDPAFATEPTRRQAYRRVRLERLGPAEVTVLAERHGCLEHAAFLYELSGGSPCCCTPSWPSRPSWPPRGPAPCAAHSTRRHGTAPGIRPRPVSAAAWLGRYRPPVSGPRTTATAPFPDLGGPFARAVHACLHRAGATAAAVARAAALSAEAATPERIADLTGLAPPAVRQGLAALRGAGLLSAAGVPHAATRTVILGARPSGFLRRTDDTHKVRTAMNWDKRFEELLREYLPFLGADVPLEDDTDLRVSGLDSLGAVELLGSLEGAYGIHFVDDVLTLDTFATPAALWQTMTRLQQKKAA
ncbi:AAA family ATPase [Streptomyces lasalocidi]